MPTTPPHNTPHASRPHTNHPLPTTIWLPSPDEPHAAPAPGTVLPDWAIERIRTVFTTRAGQLPAPLLKFTVQDTEPGMDARTPVITYADRANLAHVPTAHLLEAFTEILAQCRTMLRPGGTAVITTRPWRERGELIDLPSAVLAAGKSAGLIPTERCVALLAGIRNNRLITRPSFFQMKNVNHARRQGIPPLRRPTRRRRHLHQARNQDGQAVPEEHQRDVPGSPQLPNPPPQNWPSRPLIAPTQLSNVGPRIKPSTANRSCPYPPHPTQ
ncbi:hypothetical protein [Streptomyces sp. WZ-12]|uniref:hypothetical protein n=1 Tax=Streptomyces sp. WZ-12 TaxID=3030210 RepID=UPI002380FE59|nr:hypothetical protein [Streptomyces sp. WZ-12]